jgi:hypothetical protein
MVNANDKGARAERDVLTYLHVLRINAERLRLAGTYDRGDLWVPGYAFPETITDIRLEIKNHLLKNLPNTMAEISGDLEKLRKLFPQDLNIGVIARPGKSVADWWTIGFVKDVFGDPRAR